MNYNTDNESEIRQLLAALPAYVQGLAGSAKVDLEISNSAQTGEYHFNTRKVVIPALPFPGKGVSINFLKELMAIYMGLAVHETGHALDTDADAVRKAIKKGGEPLRDLMNAIEDVRMEACRCDALKGGRLILDQMTDVMIERGYFPVITMEQDIAWRLSGWVLYYLRGTIRQQQSFSDLAVASWGAFEGTFGPAALEIKELCDLLGPRMLSAQDSLGLAEAIRNVIRKQADQDPSAGDKSPDKPKSGGNSEPDDGSDSDDAGSSADSEGKSSGKQPGDDKGKGKAKGKGKGKGEEPAAVDDADASAGSCSGSSSDAEGTDKPDEVGAAEGGSKDSDSDSDSKSPSSGGARGNASPAQVEAAKRFDSGQGGEGAKDLGDLAGHALSGMESEAEKVGPVTQIGGTGRAGLDGKRVDVSRLSYDPTRALAVTAQLRSMLRRKLRAVTESKTFDGRRGSFNEGRIFRESQGRADFFTNTEAGRSLDTDIVVLLDGSGSMKSKVNVAGVTRMDIASDAAYATTVALEGVSGLRSSVGVFPQMRNLKSFTERAGAVQGQFSVTPGGSTPLADGLNLAASMMRKSKASRKLVVVLTDGEADKEQRPLIAPMVKGFKRQRIEVICIGINCDAGLSDFESFTRVDDILELPQAMLTVIQDKLV